MGNLRALRNNSFLNRGLIKSLIFGAATFLPGAALALDDGALPSGGNVVSGDASFDYSIENQLHIQQNSDRAVINWNSFNIGKNALTQFHQNNSSSIAVNRVTGSGVDPTQILGALKANGIVMVLDQNGVFFGQDSVVDVGGIIASTGNINDADFMSGQNILELMDINTGASIINEGTITVAEGGLAAFVAPHVVNNGVIEAKMGRVALASGTKATLDLYGDGLVELAIDDELRDALIDNNGTIDAQGGSVLVTVPTAQNIVDNVINMDGLINVSSVTQVGGKIVLEGGNISVSGGLKANGKTGGGTIHVGGEYLGSGDTRHAQKVYIYNNALIEASALDNGNGGEVIIWSDQETWMAGSIKALGGANGGNGGFIETSSKDYLRIRGYADASASNGSAGQWLLDPSNVSIVNGAGFDASAGGTVNPTTDSYTVDADTIETALNAGTSVTITTTNAGGTEAGDITMTGATINKTAGADTSLTLQADNAIILTNSFITSTTGALDVTLHADSDNNDAGYIHVRNTDITTNGGDFVAGGGLNPLTDYAWGTSVWDDGVVIDGGSQISTGTGNISIMGHGWDDAATSNLTGVTISQGSDLITTTGNITIDGVGGDGGINNTGVAVTGTFTGISSVSGVVTITGQGGTAGAAASRNNHGISLANIDLNSTGTGAGAATFILNGTGASADRRNHGIVLNSTNITTIDGDFSFTGQGGDSLTDESVGVYIYGNTYINSTGTGTDAANIIIDGTGGDGTLFNRGVYMRGSGTIISTVDGNISITGQGGSNGINRDNQGIYMWDGATVSSTGTGGGAGTITLDGTGGNGTDNNYGVYLTDAGTTVTSVDGAIDITGQGGSSGAAGSDNNYGIYVASDADLVSTGTGADAATITLDGTGGAGEDNNHGVYLSDVGTVISSVDGDIGVTGQGGSVGGAGSISNYGIRVANASDVLSTGTGVDAANITLSGTGGNGAQQNSGIVVQSNATSISAVDGDIILTGIGLGTTMLNTGISVITGADIISTGLGSGAGTITLDGTGGNGTDNNYGVYLTDAGTTVTSVDGAIDITGQGGNGTNTNHGIFIDNDALLESTGTGSDSATITLNGTGNGVNSGYGFSIEGDSDILSVDGDINITALSNGTNDNNTGMNLRGSSTQIASSGTGAGAANITISGTGGVGDDNNDGFDIAGGSITGVDGNIDLTGIGRSNGGAASNNNVGIRLSSSFDIISTGTGADAGTITLDGTGGNGTNNNYGVYLTDLGTTVTSVDGNIDITGQGQGSGINNDDFYIDNAGITTTNSDIDLSADTYVLANAASVSSGNDLNITARTNGTSIGLGAGAGALNLDNTELNLLSATGAVRIGEVTSASTINIDNVNVAGAGYDLEVIGGQITVDNGLTGGGTVFLQSTAGQDIILNDAVTAVGAGNSLVLASDDEFINNFGVGALNPGAGRYLVFVESPDKITAGGLAPSELYEETFTSLGAISIPGTDDYFVYEVADPNALFDIVEVDPYQAESNVRIDVSEDLADESAENSEEAEGTGCLAKYGSMSGSCLISSASAF